TKLQNLPEQLEIFTPNKTNESEIWKGKPKYQIFQYDLDESNGIFNQ
ncbi:18889_t:CDS:1, partial [Gigaspora margarita]